MTYSYS